MKKNKLKILYVGQMKPWDVGYPFKESFELLGHKVETLDPSQYYSVSFLNRVVNKFLKFFGKIKNSWSVRIYFNTEKLNSVILNKVKDFSPNIVLFDNMIWVNPRTVISMQELGVKVFAWHNHDITDHNNTSYNFYKTIPLCDAHFTTKSYQFQEFLIRDAKKVVFTPFASDPNLYYPEKVPEKERKKLGADIVFVGSYYEKYRGDILERLCQKGYDIKVYGNRWERYSGKCLREKSLMFRPVEGEEYRKVMNSSKIALGLLAKVIPEQHTHRTFEIPSCGSFMLHERNPEVTSFFKEGEEAEFFGSFEELCKKIDYYLTHDKERKKIAEAGHERAISYEHSYRARVQKILDVFYKITENKK